MTRARMGWLFLAAMGCGSKKETVETLPATIKYELALNDAPESRHGPIRYAIRICDPQVETTVSAAVASAEHRFQYFHADRER